MDYLITRYRRRVRAVSHSSIIAIYWPDKVKTAIVRKVPQRKLYIVECYNCFMMPREHRDQYRSVCTFVAHDQFEIIERLKSCSSFCLETSPSDIK